MIELGVWSRIRAFIRTSFGRFVFTSVAFGSAWLLFPEFVPPRVALRVDVDGYRCGHRLRLELHPATKAEPEDPSLVPLASMMMRLDRQKKQTTMVFDRRLPRGRYVVDAKVECSDGTIADTLQRPLDVDGDVDVRYHLRDRCSCPSSGPSS